MVLCVDATHRSNGIHQLSHPIVDMRFILLWNWFWICWQIRKIWGVHICRMRLGTANNMEQYLVTLFQLRSTGMVMAKSHILEEAALQEMINLFESFQKRILPAWCHFNIGIIFHHDISPATAEVFLDVIEVHHMRIMHSEENAFR